MLGLQVNIKNNDIFFVEDTYSNKIGIGIKTSSCIDVEEIKKIRYFYIEYEGIILATNNNEKCEAYFIKFDTESKKFLEGIIDQIYYYFKEKETKNIYDAIKYIVNLFTGKKCKKNIIEKLIGDIGEALFMLECKKYQINIDEFFRKKEESLYDFKLPNSKWVEVKSSSKFKNEIVIDGRQLSEAQNKIFVVSKFQILECEKNILDLYAILKSSNILLKEKEEYWKNKTNISGELKETILEDFTIDIKYAEVFVLENQLLPIVKIIKKGSLKNIKCYIDISSSNKISVESLMKNKDENNI